MKKEHFIYFWSILLISCSQKPPQLKVSENASLMIEQRFSKTIKGTWENIEVTLGDITSGRVQVTITGKNRDKTVYLDQVMFEGDEAMINYHGKYYKVYAEELINHLFSEDYGQFVFNHIDSVEYNTWITELNRKREQNKKVKQEIHTILQEVEKSDLVFIRNGELYNANEAANHLREKYEMEKQDISSFSDFVTQVASYSMLSGEHYLVIEQNGDTLQLNTWIQQKHKQAI